MIRFSGRFVVSASVLFLCFIWSQYLYPEERTVSRTSFDEFPMDVGAWEGRQLWMDQNIVRVLQVDDYILRHYTHTSGAGVTLYVGFYNSLRRVAYHSPKYCLPGNGWQIVNQRIVHIPVDPLRKTVIEANYVVLQKGLDKQLFLYWYQDRGRNIVSDYWAKWYVFWDSATRSRTDGALVRISSVIVDSEQEVFEHQVEFIRSALPLLRDYLPG